MFRRVFRHFNRSLAALTLACGLVPRLVAAETEVNLGFSGLQKTYTGGQLLPGVTSSVSGLDVQLSFTSGESERAIQTVYSRMPDPLALSYSGLNFNGNKTAAVGDAVAIASGAQFLTAVEVVLVSTARASDWPALATANPDGFVHPVTLHVFSRTSGGGLEFLAQAGKQVLIPWRPATLPDGSPYPHNGTAFPVKIYFPGNTVLPSQIVVMVSFNTQNGGFQPLGASGPYNSINLPLNGTSPSTGSDLDPNGLLWVKKNEEGVLTWIYPSTGFQTTAPLFRVEASPSPAPSVGVPVDAGQYGVTATVSSPGYFGHASAVFTVLPAPAAVTLGNLEHVADGSPKAATVSTQPGGLPATLLYDGSAVAPSAPGVYPVTAAVTDPNHTGTASGELVIRQTFGARMQDLVDAGDIPANLTGDLDDPDGDGLSNLLEYALGLDPGKPSSSGQSAVETTETEIHLTYRRNRLATGLTYLVQAAEDLSSGWTAAAATETVVGSDGDVEIVRATVTTPPGQAAGFLRLRVSR